MNNDIKIFKNEDFGKVRVAEIDNEPWFIAADVCKILDVSNSSMALNRLDDDGKKNTLISKHEMADDGGRIHSYTKVTPKGQILVA